MTGAKVVMTITTPAHSKVSSMAWSRRSVKCARIFSDAGLIEPSSSFQLAVQFEINAPDRRRGLARLDRPGLEVAEPGLRDRVIDRHTGAAKTFGFRDDLKKRLARHLQFLLENRRRLYKSVAGHVR